MGFWGLVHPCFVVVLASCFDEGAFFLLVAMGQKKVPQNLIKVQGKIDKNRPSHLWFVVFCFFDPKISWDIRPGLLGMKKWLLQFWEARVIEKKTPGKKQEKPRVLP